MPQTPTDLVKAEFGPGADDPTRVWSVGNLALAESAINQSLGNRPFSHKRTIYPQTVADGRITTLDQQLNLETQRRG